MTIEEASSSYQLAADNCGLRKGYKQTEVGVIPEDWNAKSLGSFTTLITNGFVGQQQVHMLILKMVSYISKATTLNATVLISTVLSVYQSLFMRVTKNHVCGLAIYLRYKPEILA